MPSMVVIFFPETADTGVTHDRMGDPSAWTVQAPQSAMPQPNLVPVRPITSRNAHRSGMSAGASTFSILPLTLSVTMCRLLRRSFAEVAVYLDVGTTVWRPSPALLRI